MPFDEVLAPVPVVDNEDVAEAVNYLRGRQA